MSKRILITGAAGFLGSHLCDRFIKEGYQVIGMDNLITGDMKNIEHLLKMESFEFYHHDITKYVQSGICRGLAFVRAGKRKESENSNRVNF